MLQATRKLTLAMDRKWPFSDEVIRLGASHWRALARADLLQYR
jgi:hypothetical protein